MKKYNMSNVRSSTMIVPHWVVLNTLIFSAFLDCEFLKLSGTELYTTNLHKILIKIKDWR